VEVPVGSSSLDRERQLQRLESEGRSSVDFRVTGSCCGIPIARVLRGQLEGLFERDDLAMLNPKSRSMRLEIQVSGLSFVSFTSRADQC